MQEIVERYIAAWNEKDAQRRRELVDAHHEQARFTWHLGPEGAAEPIVVGFDVAVLNGGGQIRSVYGFLDKVPAA